MRDLKIVKTIPKGSNNNIAKFLIININPDLSAVALRA